MTEQILKDPITEKIFSPTVIGYAADVLDHLQVMKSLVEKSEIMERFSISLYNYRKMVRYLELNKQAKSTVIGGKKSFLSDYYLTDKLLDEKLKTSSMYLNNIKNADTILEHLRTTGLDLTRVEIVKNLDLTQYAWTNAVEELKKTNAFKTTRCLSRVSYYHIDHEKKILEYVEAKRAEAEELNEIKRISRVSKVPIEEAEEIRKARVAEATSGKFSIKDIVSASTNELDQIFKPRSGGTDDKTPVLVTSEAFGTAVNWV